jgi:dTDP-4-amino-4,6-dideoxygalactose transaminase
MTGLKVFPARVVFSDEDVRIITERIAKSLKSGGLTLGPTGKEFETEFAKLCGTKHAVAVNSGTSALEIALRAVGVQGREVIVPANTFFATAAAAVHAGGVLRLADVERETFALDPRDLEKRLTKDTAAVVIVHIGGVVSPHTPAIVEMCKARGIACIEDAARPAASAWLGRSRCTRPRSSRAAKAACSPPTTTRSPPRRASTSTRARPASPRTCTRASATTGA